MSEKTRESLQKHSMWAVRVVADQTGKSYFEGMAKVDFSAFLYTLMRYKNESMFSLLATNLRSSESKITEFWNAILEERPTAAVEVLGRGLLKKHPRDWSAMGFLGFLQERTSSLQNTGGAYSVESYGKSKVAFYEKHTQTYYFKGLLHYEALSAKDWKEVLTDWQEVVDNMRLKNHYLRNRVLRQITESGFSVLERIIKDLFKMRKGYLEPNGDLFRVGNREHFNLCHGAQDIILNLGVIFDNGHKWHGFEQEEMAQLLERFYYLKIALYRQRPDMWAVIGKEFFQHAFGSGSMTHYTKNPNCLDEVGVWWGTEKSKEAKDQYGCILY